MPIPGVRKYCRDTRMGAGLPENNLWDNLWTCTLCVLPALTVDYAPQNAKSRPNAAGFLRYRVELSRLWGHFPCSADAFPAAGRPLGGNGWRGAGVDRLCAGFGFSIKPTRNIDDPARTAADRFAGTRGGAAEGAAEE